MATPKHRAQRSCLGCRKVQGQDSLVRYVLSPEGQVLVDYRKKLPGRGAYTCFDKDCLAAAVGRKQFGRAFKGAGETPVLEELSESLIGQVRERILDLIGVARKSSQVVSGGSMVLAALGEGSGLALVVVADDISEGVGQKVRGKAAAKKVPCFSLVGKDVLGQRLGKSERSVVGLKAGPLAESLRAELIRYEYIVGEN